jgi:ribonuclease D
MSEEIVEEFSTGESQSQITAEPLLYPRNGLPELVTTNDELAQVISKLSAGHGPIAIDAERASGYKYSQRAYLIQIFRRGGGLHLIDPISANSPDLWKALGETFQSEEWIIHASTQDLPCLTELGLYPKKLFDTELGARIAGLPRVGLGPLAESLLHLTLAKEHSAVDWSKRPLNPEWLTYAALDVDVLVDLRDKVQDLLVQTKKLEWAEEDFAFILGTYGPGVEKIPRKDPWRRTSGMHKVRDRRVLAIIKTLWNARDAYAAKIDIAPGRVFNDEALIATALGKPTTLEEMRRLLTKRSRLQDLPLTDWFELIREALALAPDQLPELRTPSTSLPPPKLWKERNPLGYARLTHARAAVISLAAELNMPAENLISPEAIRKLVWPNPPAGIDLSAYIEAALLQASARPWQVAALTQLLIEPLQAVEALEALEALPETEPGESAEETGPSEQAQRE